jgi:hypothetical protein
VIRSGAGVVRLRDGRVYSGEVTIAEGVVTVIGRLRTRDLAGEHVRPERELMWPLGRIDEIAWDGAATA